MFPRGQGNQISKPIIMSYPIKMMNYPSIWERFPTESLPDKDMLSHIIPNCSRMLRFVNQYISSVMSPSSLPGRAFVPNGIFGCTNEISISPSDFSNTRFASSCFICDNLATIRTWFFMSLLPFFMPSRYFFFTRFSIRSIFFRIFGTPRILIHSIIIPLKECQ